MLLFEALGEREWRFVFVGSALTLLGSFITLWLFVVSSLG